MSDFFIGLATAYRKLFKRQYQIFVLERKTIQPFYVGKGKGMRVFVNWKNALAKNPKVLEKHELCIRRILKTNKVPQIQLLAYNLEKSKEKRYALAERVLQDALLAWSSHLDRNLVIVGAWGIKGNKGRRQGGRYRFPAFDNPELRRCFVGCRLKGGGNRWQGPSISLGTST